MCSPVEKEIRKRIVLNGKITFAEFMAVLLYHPQTGYYTSGLDHDYRRDYFTSPAAHPAFGALVAVLLSQMWESMGKPDEFHAIEVGSGDGLFARDILRYSSEISAKFKKAIRYIAIDRSANRMKRSVGDLPYDKIVSDTIPLSGITGCVFSNELIDSFPVRRFEFTDGKINEIFVTVVDGIITEHIDVPVYPRVDNSEEISSLQLKEGSRIEVNTGIKPWLTQVGRCLDEGFLLTMDYGYESKEHQLKTNNRGTIQTYYKHMSGSSPYDRIGLKDITAHVDFPSIISEGISQGIRPVSFLTQRQFLSSLGIEIWMNRIRTINVGNTVRQANMMAMRELINPDGLGGFRVLVQEKKLSNKSPVSFDSSTLQTQLHQLPIPLMRSEHISLISARYPHIGFLDEELQ
tara:strand:- start:36 stop:1250 length:1215 start_codon:yes stop_codon:yes gene_type:complete